MSKHEDPRIIVRMNDDYTTSSGNLGKRTYKAGECYQVCNRMLAELTKAGVAKEAKSPKPWPTGVVIREQVTVVPKVTRWISANGADRHDLIEGKPVTVPSNLAAYLTTNGLAEAA